jgi:GT2 family glycosyltransferase
VEAELLERAVDTVRKQVYPHWELCIADDASTAAHVAPLLNGLASADGRIKVRRLDRNGHISQATNAATELARGEFLVFMDHDDELTPECLLEIAKAVSADPECDIIYSDDDKIDLNGRRYAPQFKPDWSPELLLTYMYFSHVFAMRRELFEQLGGCRVGFEGCQDYDLALRAVETARRIVHIPRILYHWRSAPGSTATSGAAKPESFERGVRAVQEALDRRGIAGVVSRPDFAIRGQLGVFQIDFPDSGPRVAIIIPTRNRLDLLRPCIESILTKTAYANYEVVVIDNESDDPATLKYLSRLSGRCRAIRLSCPGGKFNYSWLNNEAVRRVDADFVLFLNNDTEVRRPEWLSQMVGYGGMPGVAAVGARLLFPNGTVQHAGVIQADDDRLAGTVLKGLPAGDPGYLAYAMTARNCSAATAACLLVRREAFVAAGGFNENEFAVAYNDVDLCLRLRNMALRIVYAPRAELTHFEGASRGHRDNPLEMVAYQKKWGHGVDPYYHPSLSRVNANFDIQTRRQLPDSASPTRALFVSHNLNREGAPLSLFELVVGLKERGRVEPEVFAPIDGPLASEYRRCGIRVHIGTHPLRHSEQGVDPFTMMTRFGRWARERRFDAIAANTLETFWAVHAAKIVEMPAIWIVRESVDPRQHFRILGGLAATALETFSLPYRVVFVAKATRKLMQDYDHRHNFEVIHNSLRSAAIEPFRAPAKRIAARSEINAGPDHTVFAIHGTTCPRKGQLDFARGAVRLLESGRRNLLFLIVGCRPGEYLEQIRECVARHADSFRLMPESDGALRMLAASDVFVCCSHNESYPRVVLEALAMNKPIVTTTVFGIAEQVTPNFSALSFDPGDIDALAAHLARLADDPAERRRLAEGAAIEWAGLAGYDELIERHEQLIREAALIGQTMAEPRQSSKVAA